MRSLEFPQLLQFLLPAALLPSVASAKINWSPCEGEPSLQCATLDVPFDYTSSNSTETLALQLIKIPAPLGSKGSILANPGGPGQPGRAGIVGLASPLLAYVSFFIFLSLFFLFFLS